MKMRSGQARSSTENRRVVGLARVTVSLLRALEAATWDAITIFWVLRVTLWREVSHRLIRSNECGGIRRNSFTFRSIWQVKTRPTLVWDKAKCNVPTKS